MSIIAWNRYPLVSQNTQAKSWLLLQTNLASNAIDAYGRALNDYLAFCARCEIVPATATNEHISLYVSDLTSRPHKLNANVCLGWSAHKSSCALDHCLTTLQREGADDPL